MPETVGGIPLHPLIVHAVVVLIPLAGLGVLLLSLVPRWRAGFAPLVLALTAIATVSIPLATQTGESLEEVVGESEAVEEHAELGESMLWFAVPLLVAAFGLWWLGRRARAGRDVPRWLPPLISVLGVVASLAATVMVVLVGHSGAESVWGG